MSKFSAIKDAINVVIEESKPKNDEETEMLSSVATRTELAEFLQKETDAVKHTTSNDKKKIEEKITAENARIAAAAKKAEEEYRNRMRENNEKLAKLLGTPVKPGKEEVPLKEEKPTFAQIAEESRLNWGDEDPETETETKPEPKKEFETVGKKQPKVVQSSKSASKKPVNAPINKTDLNVPAIPIEHPNEAADYVGNLCYSKKLMRFVICIQMGDRKIILKMMPSIIFTAGKPYKLVEHNSEKTNGYPDPERTHFYVPDTHDTRCFHNNMKFWPASEEIPNPGFYYRLGSVNTFKDDLEVIDDADMRLYDDLAGHHFMMALMAKYFKN